MDATFRPGLTSDADAVLALWARSGAESTHTDTRHSLAALVAHDAGALILAESDDGVVGSVIAAWDGWRGSIYRLVVDPSHRRQGLAGQLLQRAEARLSVAGALRLQAVVVESEPLATGFWNASGWERQRERLRFVRG
jgi:ribosomal protein S18 acetylase RimI-like enzyme